MDSENVVTSKQPFIIVSTSAGSGKTELLAKRFVYLLLRYCSRDDDLRTFLAITFTREAAREMKLRILKILGDLRSGQFERYTEIVEAFEREDFLRRRAGEIYWLVLENYPRLQISTIDSFMDRIRQLVLVELGLKPGIRIEKALDREVFDVVMEDIISAEDRFKEVLELSRVMAEQSSKFEWDILSAFNERVMRLRDLEDKSLHEIVPIFDVLESDKGSYKESPVSEELASLFNEVLPGSKDLLSAGVDFSDFLRLFNSRTSRRVSEFVQKALNNPKIAAEVEKGFLKEWRSYNETWDKASRFYRSVYRKDYLKILNKMRVMSISDTSRVVYGYLSNPENLSDKVISLLMRYRHILVDEFQDTDPQQWEILLYFISELFATGGTLFIVGDIKQSIYVFRNADYKIMHTLISPEGYKTYGLFQEPEISSGTDRNFRSAENIVRFVNEIVFNEDKFLSFLRSEMENILGKTEGELSISQKAESLALKYRNIWIPIKQKPMDRPFKGYVRNFRIPKPGKNPSGQDLIEAAFPVVNEILCGLRDRYSYGDIGILTMKNDEVIAYSSMIKEMGIPVISYSSLDIRGQAVLTEVVSLVRCIADKKDLNSGLNFATGHLMQCLSKQSAGELAKEYYRRIEGQRYFDVVRYIADLCGIDLEKYPDKVNEEPLSRVLVELVEDLGLNSPETVQFSGAITRFLDYLYKHESKGGYISLEVLEALFERFQEENGSADEELSFPKTTGVDAIQVMTFHKAKGLGFPVVISIFSKIRSLGGSEDKYYFIKHYHKGKRSLSPFKLKSELIKPLRTGLVAREEFNRLLEAYTQDQVDELVQDINTIYVGLTRSMEEQYNIYFEGTKVASLFESAGIKPDSEYGNPMPCHVDTQRRAGVITDIPEFRKKRHRELVPETIVFSDEAGILKQLESALLGDAVHDFLRGIEYVEDIRDFEKYRLRLEAILRKYSFEATMASEIIEMLCTFFSKEDRLRVLRRNPEGAVFREKEVLLPSGEFLRFDRVRVSEGLVEISDFKTGMPREEDSIQLRNYMNILKQVYGRRQIIGYLLYVFNDVMEVLTDV